ncbi:DUF2946 family protein [Pseudomonas mangiferae]|uniref:DUF2946 domain-containing protein n=1 Tax=Pseudomonas mangiferae TaxID=2593654 RepID=A0A553GWK6_9PSED|nr:DUF2946 family protein [Pseudomonas mangiferae]TRX73892.1 DUF2946 domain-containing protein [Pseudomonas mangiferae]
MTHPRRVRSGAWLALFAMLLLLAGPLLSQGLAQVRAGGHAAGWMAQMDCGTEHGPMASGSPDRVAPDRVSPDRVGPVAMDHGAMGHGMAGPAEADAGLTTPAADPMTPDEHWAKCGYCTLLFNSPALTATVLALPAAGVQADSRRVAPLAEGHARSAIFPGARTRAPPLTA